MYEPRGYRVAIVLEDAAEGVVCYVAKARPRWNCEECGTRMDGWKDVCQYCGTVREELDQ